MHINPKKVSFNGFAILFKILSAHCALPHAATNAHCNYCRDTALLP